MVKALIVLTSNKQIGDTGKETGFWLEEFASPYYKFVDSGYEVTVVSPAGGEAPVDADSLLEQFSTEETKRYEQDEVAKSAVLNTGVLRQINPDDYDILFYVGGHGTLFDLATDENSIATIETFYNEGKPVGTVCQGTGVLVNAKKSNGEPLVKGLQVTGFTDSELVMVGLQDVVPFRLENELVKNGAKFVHAGEFEGFSTSDGHLFTGQNPASSALLANDIVDYVNNL
eukprot:TRINITY_DN1084_c0_g1_i1.p1 TRINITY_DN1084_c0_g1~~TRINITY_DN1084_c0_g1_i1.p1  ORF type:complete len:229 (-),score=69.37 TRINITY_DN1084_c0_g1_i1:82-768(-)